MKRKIKRAKSKLKSGTVAIGGVILVDYDGGAGGERFWNDFGGD